MPVLDASLVLTGRGSPAATDEQRVTGVLGRVFPGLTVDTTPTITAEQATTIAAEASGGTTDGSARLVVLPSGSGALAWEVVVVGAHRRTCRPAATTSTPAPVTWSTSGRCRRRSSRRCPTSG